MSAVISPCGLFRYRLERHALEGDGAGAVAWIMVNPSTADAATDDATIRKVCGFSGRQGFGWLVVGNLFAFRATDIGALKTARDPIGPDNDAHLRAIIQEASIVIVAWGPLAKLPPHLRNRWRVLVKMAREAGVQLSCLGVAQDGHPRHPLMLAYSTALQPWSAP
jgi:hypothetical protein